MEESSVKIEIPGWLTLPVRLRSLLTVYFSDAYLCYKPTYTLDGEIQYIGYTIRSSAQSLQSFDEEFGESQEYKSYSVPMILPTYDEARAFIDVDQGSDNYKIDYSSSLGYPADVNSNITFDQWVVSELGDDSSKYSEEDLPGSNISERKLCIGVSSAPGIVGSKMVPMDLVEFPPEESEIRTVQIQLPDNKIMYERRTVSFIVQTSDGVEHSVHYKLGGYVNDKSLYKVPLYEDNYEVDLEYGKDSYLFDTDQMLSSLYYVNIKQSEVWRESVPTVFGINIRSYDVKYGHIPNKNAARNAYCIGRYVNKSGYKSIPNNVILPAWHDDMTYHHFVGWCYLVLYNDDGTLFDTDLQINGIKLHGYTELQTERSIEVINSCENGTITSE